MSAAQQSNRPPVLREPRNSVPAAGQQLQRACLGQHWRAAQGVEVGQPLPEAIGLPAGSESTLVSDASAAPQGAVHCAASGLALYATGFPCNRCALGSVATFAWVAGLAGCQARRQASMRPRLAPREAELMGRTGPCWDD